MPILLRLCAAVFFLTLAGLALAQQVPALVEKALQRAEIPPNAIGIHVREAGGRRVLAAANSNAPFNPASTMKLVTTGAALELLGLAFTWKTQAFADGQQAGDVLHGDLIIKGSGDPRLLVEHLWQFLRRIRAKGIREIRGNLVLDRSIFEDVPYDPASFDGDPLRPYNVGLDGLLLNFKSLSFSFIPDPVNGSVQLLLEQPFSGFAITPPRLAEGECGDWRGKLQPVIEARGVRFEGVFPASCGERTWHASPYRMTNNEYFEAVFARLWAELGGVFRGEARTGLVPPSARLIAQWESGSLAEVVRDINKHSNNVMARQVLLTIASQALPMLPATAERGAAMLGLWLAKKGIDAPELIIDNGSGLSRTERISAVTMGRLLDAAYRSSIMPEFIASMPLIGQDGTMRRRLAAHPVAGNGHIKTGTLEGVRALAGYVLAASGKRYSVVFLINHPNAGRGREAQDLLLEWIYENG